MFKALALAGVLALTAGLSACSSTQIATGVELGAAIAPMIVANTPAKVVKGATAVLCDGVAVAALAATIESQVKAGKALVGDTRTVYTATAAGCSALGGAPLTTTTVPASASSTVPSS